MDPSNRQIIWWGSLAPINGKVSLEVLFKMLRNFHFQNYFVVKKIVIKMPSKVCFQIHLLE